MSRHDFDFLIGNWSVANRRLGQQGAWEEFPASSTVAQHVDGLVQFDLYDAPAFPGRGHVKAGTVRAFDDERGEWSIVWLSNYAPPDMRPVVGAWNGDAGRFSHRIETADGRPWDVRYDWSRSDPACPRWEQSFSFDRGETWELNWTMEFRPN